MEDLQTRIARLERTTLLLSIGNLLLACSICLLVYRFHLLRVIVENNFDLTRLLVESVDLIYDILTQTI